MVTKFTTTNQDEASYPPTDTPNTRHHTIIRRATFFTLPYCHIVDSRVQFVFPNPDLYSVFSLSRTLSLPQITH